MAVVPEGPAEGGQAGITITDVPTHNKHIDKHDGQHVTSHEDEKREAIHDKEGVEIFGTAVTPTESEDDEAKKIYVPDDSEEYIDPRLKDYPILLVAKTVDLHNDFSEPILTFRFWFLATFWVVLGCAVSSMYYFKPYAQTLSSYAVQLLSWGMGDWMARVLPKKTFTIFGKSFSLNPGPWNAKEHSLIVVAYWGSCYTAYGLGPLSAMELYYGRKINPGWGICFLLTSQMIGYAFAGIYRDILVRPPKIYYPGVLPNVALFNAMHKNPSVTKNSIRFFAIVATATFVYQWFPGFIFPLLSSMPLLCYFGHGYWKAFIMGSGYYGFGMLDVSLDWNYASYLQPLYTPLWSNAHQIGGAVFVCWLLYPILYFTNSLDALNFPPMSSGTFDIDGNKYNVSRVLTPEYTLDQAAMDAYSPPRWALSYALYFFWGFAASAGALFYAFLWYGKDSYGAFKDVLKGRRTTEDYNDPYIQLMSRTPRVPHWWYIGLMVPCLALSFATIYGAQMGLPWWGFIVITLLSVLCTFPNGILWGVANTQVGMAFLSELLAGAMFPGNPTAVLTCMTYGRQILEQNLNLISDYKFGFYMKVPEKEMFWGQVYGTLLGPFVNYGMMRFVIDKIGKDTLLGRIDSNSWYALKTKNYYSLSVLWGVIGPKVLFSPDSPYRWIYWSFLLGPGLVVLTYIVHRFKPHWNIEQRFNVTMLLYGATIFPVYQTTNLMTSALLSFIFMGYILRYHPVWFRKYNYLLGTGLDCGTQVCATVIMFAINLPNLNMVPWAGNNLTAPDLCFPPADLPPNVMN